MDFAIRADNKVKLKESGKKDKYLDLAKEQKKTMGHESDGDSKSNWCAWYSIQRFDKRTGELENGG